MNRKSKSNRNAMVHKTGAALYHNNASLRRKNEQANTSKLAVEQAESTLRDIMNDFFLNDSRIECRASLRFPNSNSSDITLEMMVTPDENELLFVTFQAYKTGILLRNVRKFLDNLAK